MTDPFRVDGPAAVSFSGGRTSGYMLRRILDAHGGALPPDVHVLFANTGKEREETLAFVRDCGARWGVPVAWVEYAGAGAYRETTFATAGRAGEPFDRFLAEIAARPVPANRIPNPVTRQCTAVLKRRVLRDWMRDRGYEHWDVVAGIRADEPARAARLRQPQRERFEFVLPLVDARVGEPDVMAFWRAQPFDLGLRSYEGNCDLCYLKSVGKRLRLIAERPASAAWWAAAERRAGAPFRIDTPPYAKLADAARRQLSLPIVDDDPTDLGDCACTD